MKEFAAWCGICSTATRARRLTKCPTCSNPRTKVDNPRIKERVAYKAGVQAAFDNLIKHSPNARGMVRWSVPFARERERQFFNDKRHPGKTGRK